MQGSVMEHLAVFALTTSENLFLLYKVVLQMFFHVKYKRKTKINDFVRGDPMKYCNTIPSFILLNASNVARQTGNKEEHCSVSNGICINCCLRSFSWGFSCWP